MVRKTGVSKTVRQKPRTMRAVILLTILAAVYAAPHVDDKRFIVSSITNWFNHLMSGLQNEWHQLTNGLHNTEGPGGGEGCPEKTAKSVEAHLTTIVRHCMGLPMIAVSLDQAVNNLIPLITSSTSQTVCVSVCTGAATSVLGPVGTLAGSLCDVACKAALAKLQQAAG